MKGNQISVLQGRTLGSCDPSAVASNLVNSQPQLLEEKKQKLLIFLILHGEDVDLNTASQGESLLIKYFNEKIIVQFSMEDMNVNLAHMTCFHVFDHSLIPAPPPQRPVQTARSRGHNKACV